MIVIADSGATKTDWSLMDESRNILRVKTNGINPFTQSEDSILAELASFVEQSGVRNATKPLHVYFYGAGCTQSNVSLLQKLIKQAVCNSDETADVHVASDLMGAARALFCNEEGIACILGTGSNSCLYDGSHIVANTPPLGFILGDEGSGAYIGKQFLRGLFKGLLPSALKDRFLVESGLTYTEIINRVYRCEKPNRFLASLVPYVQRYMDNPQVRQLVVDGFSEFLKLNVLPYQHDELPIGFVGGVAFSYHEILSDVVSSFGFKLAKVMKAPIDGLLNFHQKQLETH